jgi:hypothetical protein
MNLVRGLSSGCRSGTLKLGQFDRSPCFDLIEQPLQARVVRFLPLISDGPSKPLQGAGGQVSVQNGQLQVV